MADVILRVPKSSEEQAVVTNTKEASLFLPCMRRTHEKSYSVSTFKMTDPGI